MDLPKSDLKEICFHTGISQKRAAIQKMVMDGLMLRRRAVITRKFILGEWGVDLQTLEAGQAKIAGQMRKDRRHGEVSNELDRDLGHRLG